MNAQVYRSSARDLGALERRYAASRTVRPTLLFLTVFGVPGLGLLTGLQSGEGQVFAGDRTTNACLGVALLVIAAVAIVAVHRKATLSVAVHEHGLVWTERGLPRTVLWREIVAIRGSHVARLVAGVEAARSEVYRIVLERGSELVATNLLARADELAARIERAITETQLPAIRAKLALGATVTFGPLAVTSRGIELGSDAVAWTDLGAVEVEAGHILVRSTGAGLDVEWARVDNARLFLEVVRERRKLPNRGSTSSS